MEEINIVVIRALLQSLSLGLTPPAHSLSSYAEIGGMSPVQAPIIATLHDETQQKDPQQKLTNAYNTAILGICYSHENLTHTICIFMTAICSSVTLAPLI